MRNHVEETRNVWRRLVLLTAAIVALAGPGFLVLITAPLRAQNGPSRPGANSGGKPSCLYCPKPQYTDAAREAKFQGSVVLQVIIQPDGHATNIKVVRGPGPSLGLEEKAIEAVKTWRFRPAVGPSGTPVATITQIEVTFRLPDETVVPK
jgi:TonB family protein